MPQLLKKNINRPCEPIDYEHCFHLTGNTVSEAGSHPDKPKDLLYHCCHCGKYAVVNQQGVTLNVHGKLMSAGPQLTEG
jgi:hypothetical protein